MDIDLTELLPDGRPRYLKMANGGIHDLAEHRIVVGAPLTSEQAREMVVRKKQIAQERAIKGIDNAAIEAGLIPKDATGEGWRAVVQHVTHTLLTSKNLRGQAEAANFLGKASGFTQEEKEGAGFTEKLGALLERYLGRDIIDGEVRNVE